MARNYAIVGELQGHEPVHFKPKGEKKTVQDFVIFGLNLLNKLSFFSRFNEYLFRGEVRLGQWDFSF